MGFYYYILRDYSWWQRVSKTIYDVWTQPKKITTHELTEEELESFDETEYRQSAEN